MSDILVDAIQPNGKLYQNVPYLAWHPGGYEATLDGDFTAAELRAIADHMDKHKVP